MTEDSKALPTQAEQLASSFADVESAPAAQPGTRPLPHAPTSERWVLAAALVVGVLADLLAFRQPVGIGTTLSLLAALGVVVALHRRHGLRLASRNRFLYVGAAALLASAFTLRTSPTLLALDAVALFFAFVLLATRVSGRRLRDAGAIELTIALAEVPVMAAVRTGGMIGRRFRARPVDGAADQRTGFAGFRARHGRDVVIGILVAIPILAIFTALLAASDAGFARLLEDLFDWNVEAAVRHVTTVAFAGFVVATVVVASLDGDPSTRVEEQRGEWAGPAVVWIVLGSTALLFAMFLAVQGSYLFGGTGYLEERTGLTAAEYARRGFYELLVVSGLTVALLLGARASFSRHAGSARAYRLLAPTLSALTIILVIAALARMSIYADRFGLTEQRIYAVATLLWIGAVLAWLGVRIALDRALQVATFAGTAGIGVVLLLNVASPEALAARTNLERTDADGARGRVDTAYLLQLGPDATPAIVDHIDRIPAAQRETMLDVLELRLQERDDDWRGWNAGHEAAREAVERDG